MTGKPPQNRGAAARVPSRKGLWVWVRKRCEPSAGLGARAHCPHKGESKCHSGGEEGTPQDQGDEEWLQERGDFDFLLECPDGALW